MEPNSDGTDAVVVVGDRILGSGKLAEVKARLASQPYSVDETFADKIIIAGLIDQHVHPTLAALTLTLEIIAIEDWVLPSGTAKAAVTPEDYAARLTAAEKAMTHPPDPLPVSYTHLLILALALVAVLGPGMENAVLAIALTSWPPYARVARAETLTVRSSDYIAAVKLQGAGSARIIWGHILSLIHI